MKSWYVAVNSAGKVVGCTELRDELPGDGRGFVVQASSKRAAEQAALQMYREYARQKVAERRQQLRKEGRCRCGRARDSDRQLCDVCLARDKAQKERQNQRAKAAKAAPSGRAPGAKRNEKARLETASKTRRSRRDELRIETLLEVRKQWRAAKSPKAFEVWLDGEIATITGASKAA